MKQDPVYPAAPGARKMALVTARRRGPSARTVDERWRLRNGSVAHVIARDGKWCGGVIDDSDGAVHTWVNGVTQAGSGYDMITALPAKPDKQGSSDA
jgi:hypothetical protein